MKKEKSTDTSLGYLREHKLYKGMFYYKKSKRGYSKDFYNYTRASWYANIPSEPPKVIGNLPYGSK